MNPLLLFLFLGMISQAAYLQDGKAPAQKKKTESGSLQETNRTKTSSPVESPDRSRMQRNTSPEQNPDLNKSETPQQKRTYREPKKEGAPK